MKTNKIFLLAAVVLLLALGLQAMKPEASAEKIGDTRPYVGDNVTDPTPTPQPGSVVIVGPGADTPTPTPGGVVIIQPGTEAPIPTATPDGGEVVPPVVSPPPTIDPATEPVPENVTLGTETLLLHPAQVQQLAVGGCVTGSGCDIVMTSSDGKIATVHPNERIRGENPGSATITVQILWCGNVVREMTCSVTVTVKKVPYKTLRKKLYKQRNSQMLFADEGNSASTLTLYD